MSKLILTVIDSVTLLWREKRGIKYLDKGK